ncbi:MAG: PLP-dependent aminotransferase family protein [Oscillospiraceae bacterium]|nr:PLP-dependent aminotransferase family protein [Oscillospiraceae bacterium]MBQ9938671.1 PLP-dependent aminotransferase family protein [Oscillospiraceae bacterium]
MNYSFSERVSKLQPSAIREILKVTQDPTVISFAAGNPAPEAFPVDMVREITSDIFRDEPITALQYSITEGYTPLRKTIVELMGRRYGVNCVMDEVIITSGGQQTSELACKALVNEHDTVICEAPSFIGVINAFKSYNVNLVGVELEDDGMNIEELEKAITTNKNVKLIYVIPNFQNPKGICTSIEKRKAIYELAKKYGVMILEDNPYGDLRFDGENIPSIKSMDTEGLVIYAGSFSKILAPGIRVGFTVAPTPVISKMTVCKQVSDVHTTILSQMICNEFMKRVDFDAHLDKLAEIYRHKCGLMLSEMDKKVNPKIKYTRPQGGLFIWATLPEGVDMMDFCRKCAAEKVAVVPGSAFTVSDDVKTSSFRLNFSTPTDEQIIKGIDILGKISYTI